jgi:hypothetical protein
MAKGCILGVLPLALTPTSFGLGQDDRVMWAGCSDKIVEGYSSVLLNLIKGEADHAPSPLQQAQKNFTIGRHLWRVGAQRHK